MRCFRLGKAVRRCVHTCARMNVLHVSEIGDTSIIKDLYHDVLCACTWRRRLRRIVADVAGNVEVEHRCFALAQAIGRMFGDAEREQSGDHGSLGRSRCPSPRAIQVEQMPGPGRSLSLFDARLAGLQGRRISAGASSGPLERCLTGCNGRICQTRNIADFEVLRDCRRQYYWRP